MKVTINVDCTPEEARTFFGLPDVAPMQEVILNEVRDRILKNLAAMVLTATLLAVATACWLALCLAVVYGS